jgi:DNA relaxase NicK
MPQNSPLSIVSADVDWFTCTAGLDSVGEELYKRGSGLVSQFVDQGDKHKETSWQGYRGDQAGPIMVGLRGDGVVLRASGVGARVALEKVRDLAIKPTRVDVQMTVLHGSVKGLPQRLKRQAMQARSARNGAPYRVKHIDGCGDGDAVILGDRSSEAFGRSYDKYRETLQKYKESVALRRELAEGFPDGSWRYEVEYKGSKALSVTERLLEADFERAVIGDVRGWYADHGIKIPVGDELLPAVKEAKYVPDDERSLAWIRAAVRPTVDRLAARKRLGDVLEASGIGPQLRELDVDELLKLLGLA